MSDPASHSDSSSEVVPSTERVVEGIGVAPGIAIGTVYRYQVDPPSVSRRKIEPDEVEAELALLDDALERAHQELSTVHAVAEERLDDDGEAIFAAQQMMLRDEELLSPIRRRIRDEHESAAHALSDVLESHRRRLESSDDQYLRERAGDLRDLETRLLQALDRGKTATRIDPNSIVVADQLTAADVIRFSRHGMLGFITARGGETSHVSIVARALDLPAVVGAGDLADVATHDRAILDGREGRLIVHPSDPSLERYRTRRAHRESLLNAATDADGAPTTTADGRTVTVRATVDFGVTLEGLDRHDADGIGLMRTEVLFLRGDHGSLDEDRQLEVYRRAAELSGPHGATIRLLDMGGDKILPFSQEEDNPFLGWRGIRVLLDRPELLRPQLRALLRANRHGSLRVLVPMVTGLEEVRRVRTLLEEEADRLSAEDVPHDPALPLGVMVEVPAVALQAELFAEATDFLSIGTNDLTQYVLAVDRGNDLVADRYDALHPAVLRLIRRTVEAGRTTDTPVALCGEMGGDVHALPLLLGLGLDTVSVPPPYLPTVRHVIAETSAAAAEPLASDALSAPDAATVRRRVRAWCDEHYDSDLFRDAALP